MRESSALPASWLMFSLTGRGEFVFEIVVDDLPTKPMLVFWNFGCGLGSEFGAGGSRT